MYAATAGLLLVCAAGLRIAVVPTPSMEGTVLVGDHLLVQSITYGLPIPFSQYRLPALKKPDRGDVVSLRSPRKPGLVLLKRVAGRGGDLLQVCGNWIFVHPRVQPVVQPNIQPGPEQAGSRASQQAGLGSVPGPGCRAVAVPEDHIFVVGDNRDHSEDSRHWGPVPEDSVTGEPLLVLWSYSAPGSAWLDAGGNLRPLIYLSALAHPSRTRWWRTGTMF